MKARNIISMFFIIEAKIRNVLKKMVYYIPLKSKRVLSQRKVWQVHLMFWIRILTNIEVLEPLYAYIKINCI